VFFAGDERLFCEAVEGLVARYTAPEALTSSA
jgi:hypothetical protein